MLTSSLAVFQSLRSPHWTSDIKRDFHNAREKAKTTASVEVVDFKRVVTATRDDARDVILTQLR